MADETLGFIGVGDMGGPMAGRLLDAGYTLLIHDVRREATAPLAARGATVLDSPKAVADAVKTVIVSLPTPDVVRAVAIGDNGVIHGSSVRQYVDLSTTGAVMAVQISTALKEKGIEALDSPVSGGVRGAEAGTLALMVSGAKAFYEDMLPVFAAIGKNPFYLGEAPGLGQTMKLTNNYLSADRQFRHRRSHGDGRQSRARPESHGGCIQRQQRTQRFDHEQSAQFNP